MLAWLLDSCSSHNHAVIREEKQRGGQEIERKRYQTEVRVQRHTWNVSIVVLFSFPNDNYQRSLGNAVTIEVEVSMNSFPPRLKKGSVIL